MWARELGARNGLVIPNQAAEHYYLITDTIDGIDPDAPVFEDPASYGYYREEGGGMMVGLFEPQAAPWRVEGIPPDFSFGTIPPDWDRMAPFLEKAMARVPITLEVGVRTFFCGPESFTPDLAPAVGEAPGIRNYFVAAGMNSVGILSAGGLGRVLAHWITTGRPDVDVTGFNVDRFRPWQADDAYRAARTTEILGTVYAAHTPGKQLRTARNTLLSPVHDRLVAQGGYLREVSGLGGRRLVRRPGRHPRGRADLGPRAVVRAVGGRAPRRPRGRRPDGHELHGEVPRAGPRRRRRARPGLRRRRRRRARDDHLHPVARRDGRIEADLTVTKLAEDDFLVVASDTAHGHALAWLGRHIALDRRRLHRHRRHRRLRPAQRPGPALARPARRAHRRRPVHRGVRLPHRALGPARRGRACCWCGSPTWASWATSSTSRPVTPWACTTRCWPPGTAYGLRPVGLKALASLRMEKAYRDFGHDIDNTDCPLEVGLGFALALDKPGGFVGREAVLARKAANAEAGGMRQRLVQVRVLDPEPLLFHAEVLHRDGVPVGYVRARRTAGPSAARSAWPWSPPAASRSPPTG